MKTSHRPLSSVPFRLTAVLVALLATQVAWRLQQGAPLASASDLPPAPQKHALRMASLGEPETIARLGMVYLQSFDFHSGNLLSYKELNYGRLIDWLDSLLALDPRSQYPLFAAARVYAEVPDAVRQRRMLDFIHRQFLVDPESRWQWLAHAAIVAKHQLKDLPLALRYAQDIDKFTLSRDVPLWARQMEVFILEDMNELQAAKILLGGLLASGKIDDPGERRFLEQRLRRMETSPPPPEPHARPKSH